MMNFDYDKAVRIDTEEFLRTEIKAWDTFPSVDAWCTEIANSPELMAFVTGMDDCDYVGTYPATEMEIVPYMSTVSTELEKHMDSDEIDSNLKEYGLAFFDCMARKLAFDWYIREPEFHELVKELYTAWHAKRETQIQPNKSNICTMKLYQLCNEERWFTCGNCRQYERMFDMVREHAPVTEIATVIWICSENVDKDEIIAELNKINLNRN